MSSGKCKSKIFMERGTLLKSSDRNKYRDCLISGVVSNNQN